MRDSEKSCHKKKTTGFVPEIFTFFFLTMEPSLHGTPINCLLLHSAFLTAPSRKSCHRKISQLPRRSTTFSTKFGQNYP